MPRSDENRDTMNRKQSYNKIYESDNFFGYREGIYFPYIKAVLAAGRVAAGSTVLDVGCGQGFVANLLRKCGMKVTGIDISDTGILSARRVYGRLGIEFLVGDINTIGFDRVFDCVFTRSLSLYNIDDFPTSRGITAKLMKYVKPGGTFIFTYNTNLKTS